MKLSTRTRYGFRALAELAIAHPDRTVSVKEVAASQGLSPKYLEQIMTALKAAGLITSVRGLHGGFRLARLPTSIRLSEVFRVLEGPFAPVDCVDHPQVCPMKEVCPTRDTWVEMSNAIGSVLQHTTLQDLAERMRRKKSSFALMYHI